MIAHGGRIHEMSLNWALKTKPGLNMTRREDWLREGGGKSRGAQYTHQGVRKPKPKECRPETCPMVHERSAPTLQTG